MMTTEAQRMKYNVEQLQKYGNTPAAHFNPNGLAIEELPIIYGFENGGWDERNREGILLAEDGTFLGSHICSSESFMLSDLGIVEGTREDRHETFKEHYPNGYVMKFVWKHERHEGCKVDEVVALANNKKVLTND